MTKKELAILYWDGPMPENMRIPVRRLMRWIRFNKDLTRELNENGYISRQRVFTLKQQEIIYKYLGEP